MTHINAVNQGNTTLPEREARLRKVVGELQGVFVEQLFKAMRETVPTDGVTNGGAGEAMFSGMLDQHLAGAVPTQWAHGIGESLFRQLQPRLSNATSDTPAGTP